MKFISLFEPIKINRLLVKNRIVMPAVALFYTDNYGFTDRYKAFYRQRAMGGVGLMMIGPVAIDKVGSSPFIPGLFDDRQMDPFREFTDDLHHHSDAKIGIQLMHQGRYATKRLTGVTPIAPSAVASSLSDEVPRAMTLEDIEAVKSAYAEAALRAKAAGFDYIEILMAGGYLVGEFLSPVSNQRTDAYGGSPEKRMRFGLEIIRKLRVALGKEFALGIRVSGQDFVKRGNTIKESSLFCIETEKAGIDGINVTGGWHETEVPQVSSDVPDGAFLYLSGAIKASVSVPVFASNRLGNPVSAETALRAGFADMICWARPLIADPDLPVKIQSGRESEVVPCIGCNQGCLDAIFSGSSVSCTVNPLVGREAETEVTKTRAKKRIFVAGGGPAGMQFALTAAQRGHPVTLFEKESRLGGQVNLIGAIPGKKIYGDLVKSLVNRLMVSKVNIELNTLLTQKAILESSPHILIVATGAKPASLSIPGVDRAHVIDAWKILGGSFWKIGKRVVIIGGGATGCETALMVAKRGVPSAETFSFLTFHSADDPDQLRRLLYDSGRVITIIEMAARVAANVGVSMRWALLKNLGLMGVQIRTRTKIVAISENAVHIETPNGTEAIGADTVIMAAGPVPVNSLAGIVHTARPEILTIGDAKQIGKISDAVTEGFDMALKV